MIALYYEFLIWKIIYLDTKIEMLGTLKKLCYIKIYIYRVTLHRGLTVCNLTWITYFFEHLKYVSCRTATLLRIHGNYADFFFLKTFSEDQKFFYFLLFLFWGSKFSLFDKIQLISSVPGGSPVHQCGSQGQAGYKKVRLVIKRSGWL